MATTDFTNGVTLTDAAWFDDIDCAGYAVLSGVAGTNTITATGPATYTYAATRPPVWFIPAVTNSGATTVNVTPSGGAALGAKNIFLNGAALAGGELVAGRPCAIIYDGTQFNLLGTTFGEYRSVQVFTADGTWTKKVGTKRVKVMVVAAGGGGGAAANGVGTGASGGAGGGAAIKTIEVAALGATETVTVATAPNGGAAGNNNGTAGGSSSFGSHCSATGGAAGLGAAAGAAQAGVDGGTGSGGDVNLTGGASPVSAGASSGGGSGGSSIFSGAGKGGFGLDGSAGSRGSGGGGGGSNGVAARAGGVGGAGIVIVEEFF